MLLDEDGEGREEWLGGAGGSGAVFALGEPDSREELAELELRLVLELRWGSDERRLTGRLSVRLLLARDSRDASCSSSSSVSCSPSGCSAGTAGVANRAVYPKGNSVGSFALPLFRGA